MAHSDCAVAVEVLEHVDEDARFVSEVHRVLKPGGAFLMTTPNGDAVANTNPDHRRHYSREQLHGLLAARFDRVEVDYAIRGGMSRRLGLTSWSARHPLRTAVCDGGERRERRAVGARPRQARRARHTPPHGGRLEALTASTMCGIAGIFGAGPKRARLDAMVASQRHRGPDADSAFEDASGLAALGHNRLAIIDLSPAGRQPMFSHDGRLALVFNGEIYNYIELRDELSDYPFRTRTDSEVILAAYDRWGAPAWIVSSGCSRFSCGTVSNAGCSRRATALASSRCITTFGRRHAARGERDQGAARGRSRGRARSGGVVDVPGVRSPRLQRADVLAGRQQSAGRHSLTWTAGRLEIARWYDLAERSGPACDERPVAVVEEEYLSLVRESGGCGSAPMSRSASI
jgi:asparagine synthase (glutamine-hydrolysing)